MYLANENLVYIFLKYHLLFPPDDVLSKITDLSHFLKNFEKKVKLKVTFLNTPT